MTNPAHAQEALAYDVAIGVCRIKEADMREFRIMADWRLDPSDALDATGLELYKYFEFGLVAEKPPVKWIDDPACPGRMPAKITDKR